MKETKEGKGLLPFMLLRVFRENVTRKKLR